MSGLKESVIEPGMRNYFNNYRRKYHRKSLEDAVKATRNWANGIITAFGPIDQATNERIERKLNELRIDSVP